MEPSKVVPPNGKAGENEKETFQYEKGESNRSIIQLYLREIGEVKLLTREEEIYLAGRIKKGDRRARELMIKANLRLVVKISHDYDGNGLPLDDLINEGNMGLMKAVDRFEPTIFEAKFSTYGSWWIKQAIKRALANQSRTIRVPVHAVEKISRMRRVSCRLWDELGRQPTDEEVAAELGVSSAWVSRHIAMTIRPTSLQAELGTEGDMGTLADIIPDLEAKDPFRELQDKVSVKMVHELLQRLVPKEREILKLRFGLDGEECWTLEEVGKKFGVTRERIRQIQMIALKRLEVMVNERESIKLFRTERKSRSLGKS